MKVMLVGAVLAGGGAAQAQAQGRQDPNLEHAHEVPTVKREGYTIAGLVTHRSGEKSRGSSCAGISSCARAGTGSTMRRW